MDYNRKRKIRRILLNKLLKAIKSGNFDNVEIIYNNLRQNLGNSRPQYYNPQERGSYNYGYMETSEMGTDTPNVF